MWSPAEFRVIVRNLAYTGLATNALSRHDLADSDSDGIPTCGKRLLRRRHGAARDADADSDGMSNWQEYVAGTDPTNTLSYLKIDNLTIQTARRLTFGAVSNKTYTIQYTDRRQRPMVEACGRLRSRDESHGSGDRSFFDTSRVYRHGDTATAVTGEPRVPVTCGAEKVVAHGHELGAAAFQPP
jgi:hypothetical protein